MPQRITRRTSPTRVISSRSCWQITGPGGEMNGYAAWQIVERAVVRRNPKLHPAFRLALRVGAPLVTSALAAVSARIVQMEIRNREARQLRAGSVPQIGRGGD